MADKLLLLRYDYVEDIVERRAPHREAHLARIADWHADGRMVMAGAVGDPPTAGLFVLRTDDPAVAEEFAAEDPYVEAGLVTGRRTEPWTVVVGA